MRILMVENHAVFARTVAGHFLSAHEVDVVPTIARARDQVQRTRYDAVLVDYDLDDGKGDQLVALLVRQRFAGKIVAISAHDDGNDALQRAGASHVCPKGKFATITAVLEAT